MTDTDRRIEREYLPFRISPHMLEDLGLNLYSSLPRVLVEFIANGYDADAKAVDLTINFDRIISERERMRTVWINELKDMNADSENLIPLEERLLPSEVSISIEDNGHGMIMEEIRDKFLVTGRRRRVEERTRSTKEGRALMGRKGVGKLAGFGVARRVEVITKTKEQDRAFGIRLDFDEILKHQDTQEVRVPAFEMSDDAGLGEQGTRVTLSRLVHESLKSQEETVRRSIGDHFRFVEQEDFVVRLNGQTADPAPRELVYAWPRPELSTDELVEHQILGEDAGVPVRFQYRLRFVRDGRALLASQRGVRVYAHKRLAAAPSLLHADTNMHGFRMTDYLDGIVHADFIDNLDRDYIATDRQGLRWETPLLQPVHEFLGQQIKEACKAYQAFRDERKKEEVDSDEFTIHLIQDAQLSLRERRLATAICVKLASFHKNGVETPEYQEHAKLLVQAIGKGEIFSAISRIAEQDYPSLRNLAGEVARLTHAEIDQVLGGIRARLIAIETLQKIVETTDFKTRNNEHDIHNLLKNNPWLIDPTFFEFLSSDSTIYTLILRLESHMKIGNSIPASYDKFSPDEIEPMRKNLRPDLVFILGNSSLGRVIVVELKAPNTPLLHSHLLQLQDYMYEVSEFLKNQQTVSSITVEGRLIGTLDLGSQSNEVKRLQRAIQERGATAKWEVYDLLDLLDRTRNAHREFLDAHNGRADIKAEV